jgi:hypothetical protein
VTLFSSTLDLFQREHIPCALIGAGALAVHGIARSTFDIDLLTTSPRVLEAAFWEPLVAEGATVEVRPGGRDDPLRGVVRLERARARDVDIVVGRHDWQRDALARAVAARVLGADVPVVTRSDLILLKLYAGGPQDAWDIEQLLADAGGAVRGEVDARVVSLPPECGEQWAGFRSRYR